MTTLTTPWNLPLFGTGDPVAPLESNFNLISNALNASLSSAFAAPADLDALNLVTGMVNGAIALIGDSGATFRYNGVKWVQATPASFATVTARDTAYAKGSGAYKVQGALATTGDSGFTWEYFGAYNATTNPLGTSVAGTPTAGWFPAAGSPIACALTIIPPTGLTSSGAAQLITSWNVEYDTYGFHSGVNTDRITPKYAGRYTLGASIAYLSNTGGVRFIQLSKNGTFSSANGGASAEATAASGVTGTAPLAVGSHSVLFNGTSDFVNVSGFQNSGATLSINARFTVAYAAPPVGP